MANNTVFFPGYSAGENAYKEIDKVCSPYGTKAVVISDEISNFNTDLYYQNPSYLECSYQEGHLLD